MKTQDFVDARKAPMKRSDALKLARGCGEVYLCKGKLIEYFNMKTDMVDDNILGRFLLGPTGNLRAPAFKVGNTLVVGFDEDTYKKVLRSS